MSKHVFFIESKKTFNYLHLLTEELKHKLNCSSDDIIIISGSKGSYYKID